jgi:CBS domain containing-hemolysin-like protein
MTPRVDVIALRQPVSIEDVASAVRESGHSRFPVYQEDLDQLVGVLFVKDLFRSGTWNDSTTTADIEKRVRKPFFVPESRPLLALLQEMRKIRVAFAVVTDEHGGVEGVLTIKDLISELVGDIHDEFDSEPETEIQRVDARRWLIDGGTNVEDVVEETGMPIPDGEYVTLGGFLMFLLGRIPVDGDVCEFEGFELKIEEMDRRRVSQVVVRAPSDTVSESDSEDNDTGM